jgi:predicted TIM-barrel fold metal-dependent hydrolase
MRKIDVEAHYYDPGYLDALRGRSAPPREERVDGGVRMYVEPSSPGLFQQRSDRLADALAEVGEQRLAAMDAAGIEAQVLSLNIPGCEQLDPREGAPLARECNDVLADLVSRHPGRFVPLAALCPDPEAPEVAADELERCVRELGFRGWKLNSHVRDESLDHPGFEPIFARAAELGVPVCIHPTVPHASMIERYTGYGYMLPGPALGFAAEAALQSVRLVYSGIFDRHPALQVLLGHLGEGLYFWLYRLDFEFSKPWLTRDERIRCTERPSHYLRRNFHATTSGHFQSSAFLATYMETGAERLLFATDYPYESNEQAVAWLESQPIAPGDKERIFHGNAAALFGIA